jgi:hypothetical protein
MREKEGYETKELIEEIPVEGIITDSTLAEPFIITDER